MKKSVIVVSDADAEIAPEILTILKESGFIVTVAGPLAAARDDDRIPAAIAVVYQLPAHPAAKDLREMMQLITTTWPNLPVIGCMPAPVRGDERWRECNARAAFTAVAKSAAQLPALLREVEDQEPAYQPQPFKIANEEQPLVAAHSLRRDDLSGAFALVASLHLTASQTEAAFFSISGLGRLVKARTWTVYLVQNNQEPGLRLTSLASRSFSADEPLSFARTWNLELLKGCAAAERSPSKVAMEAMATAAMVRRTEDRTRVIAAPLVSRQKVIGVVEGIRGPGSRQFSISDMRVLETVTSSIAHSLSNSERIADAERLSLTDELTRLHNARYLRQFLVNEIKRARRYRTKVAALFLDLDDFKHVNDVHGHLVGSHCLMEVAALLLPSVRDTDCVVRYGGDEFVVILPEAGPNDAVIVAERIRDKVAAHVFTGGHRLKISLTVSIGVGVFPDSALSPHQLISSADQAMYEAKAGNKNCIRLGVQTFTSDHASPPDNLPPGKQFVRIPGEKFIS